MRVDTVIVDTLAQLPAAAAAVCGQSVQSLGEGEGGWSMHAASCKVSLSCIGIAIPDGFSNPGISGLKNANPGIPGLNP